MFNNLIHAAAVFFYWFEIFHHHFFVVRYGNFLTGFDFWNGSDFHFVFFEPNNFSIWSARMIKSWNFDSNSFRKGICCINTKYNQSQIFVKFFQQFWIIIEQINLGKLFQFQKIFRLVITREIIWILKSAQSGPENLKKSRQNSWNNQFHEICFQYL